MRRTIQAAFVALLLAAPVRAALGGEAVPVGKYVSTTRAQGDWRGYFQSDLRELRMEARTETRFEPSGKPPVQVDGVAFDMEGSSPIVTESTTWSVVRPGDPDLGQTRVASKSRTATGETFEVRYTLTNEAMDSPLAVGPFRGKAIEPPPTEQVREGKTFELSSLTRTTEIVALLVAPTFEDLVAGHGIREVREAGTRLESGSLRVLDPSGKVVGFYAGDIRKARGEQLVRRKP
jgi:hypothetical protein